MGSGFRTFTAGEVLTASNVQNYLMDQSVMVFGGSAARSSAIGTANFEEGMISYLTDTDKVEAYNGTNWAQVGASAQGLTLINTTSFSAVASQSINDVFSATYNNYRLIFDITGSTGLSNFLRFRVGGVDNSSNQYDFASYGSSSTGSTYQESLSANSAFSLLGRMEATSTKQGNIIADVIKPFASDFYTILQAQTTFPKTSNQFLQITYAGQLRVQTSYTGFTIAPDSGTITGNVRVYGYNQ